MKILKLLSLTFVSVVCCVMAHAQERTDLGVLSNDDSWLPYPEYSDRQGWETLVGNHAEFLIKAGEKYLDYTWQSVDATAYLAYERTMENTSLKSQNYRVIQ